MCHVDEKLARQGGIDLGSQLNHSTTRRSETPPQVREVIKSPIPAISLGHRAAAKSSKTHQRVRRVIKRPSWHCLSAHAAMQTGGLKNKIVLTKNTRE